MLDLALGVALYAQPPHVKFPGLAAVAVARALLRRKRRRDGDASDASSDADASARGVQLEWRHLTSALHAKRAPKNGGTPGEARNSPPRLILSGVSGMARPGRFLALLGPSGSGKTSLLNALAGQTPFDKKLRLTGALSANGVDCRDGGGDTHRARVAYVRQQDVFYSELTVRETLAAAAKMRGVANEGVDAKVAETIRAVGLSACADARVGDQKTRGGISGGERKRLALACELIGDAKDIVCADEPTSGLDAFQAQRVVASLKRLCHTDDDGDGDDVDGESSSETRKRLRCRRAVIASVHQPRGSIVSMFDDACVLASGRVLYCGPLENDACVKWFARLGFPMPANANLAEFLVDLASVDSTDAESEATSAARVDALCAAWSRDGEAFVAKHALLFRDDEAGEGSSASASLMTKIASPFKAMSTRGDGSKLAESNEKKTTLIRRGARAGFFGQLLFLAKRSWRQVRRDGRTNRVRLITSLNSALVFGSIFWKLGLGQSAIQDRCGLLQVSAINAAMAALMKTISSFTSEKTIVDRERASGSYDIAPYLIGKIVAELPAGAFFPLCFGAVVFPMAGLNAGRDAALARKNATPFFLSAKFAKFAATIVVESFASSAMGLAVSAVAPNTEAAVAMGPAVMVMFIVFGGYYVNAETVPAAFRWITRCSLIKHAFAGLCVNEFTGLDFEASNKKDGGLKRGDTERGEEVLERLGFGTESVGSCLRKQLDVLGFCYATTLYVLEKNAPRFQTIEKSPEDVAGGASRETEVRVDAQSRGNDVEDASSDVDARRDE